EYGDIFNGSAVINEKVEELKAEARAELARIDEMGGGVAAIESSYMKQKLVESNSARLDAIEAGEQIVVGVNMFTETEPSPLSQGADGGILTVDPKVEAQQIANVQAWRAERDEKAAMAALAELR
ncbi:MAG TPA: protein meaA, partial [Alphaproteobacteria bacterium]|nr:protein meaA [Alphaproteobacteria bacterium]